MMQCLLKFCQTAQMTEASTMTVTVEYDNEYTVRSVFKGLTEFKFDTDGRVDATGVVGANVPLFIDMGAVRVIHYAVDQ